MSAKATIAAWLLDHADQDAFAAALEIIIELEAAGYAIVPIVPSEAMIEELARIGDGPEISAAEVWGYMLAAAKAHPLPDDIRT